MYVITHISSQLIKIENFSLYRFVTYELIAINDYFSLLTAAESAKISPLDKNEKKNTLQMRVIAQMENKTRTSETAATCTLSMVRNLFFIRERIYM